MPLPGTTRTVLVGCPKCGGLQNVFMENDAGVATHPSCGWRGHIKELFGPFTAETGKGDPGRCRGCGAEIWWRKLNGRAHPYDEDGKSHFATCPKADDFRRRG